MIRVSHLSRTYTLNGQTVPALWDVSFHIARGEYAAIVGPSGSGKSTLMHLLGCLDSPTSGSYHLGGEDVSRLPPGKLADIRGAQIGFVFQGFQLIPRMTALENVMLPLLLCKTPPAERIARARELLCRVGLQDRLDHKPAQLSGGQQQRVAIARALSRDPPLLLADEPTGALDPQSTADILRLLQDLHRENRTVLIITHDMQVARQTKRQLCIENGRLIWDSCTQNDKSSSQM